MQKGQLVQGNIIIWCVWGTASSFEPCIENIVESRGEERRPAVQRQAVEVI